MLGRVLLLLFLTALKWRECQSVMCYWCSGVGDDRECETRPYAVRTGPVYLNCRANFCLSAKVIDAESGEVQSFARLCDNVPRGNLCIRDSKLLTCYESCTSDLCNSGNPSPLHLPTVSYATDKIPSPHEEGYSPIQTQGKLGRPYKTNTLKGARNIKYGPRREMWLATKRQNFFSTQPRKYPFIATPNPKTDLKASGTRQDLFQLGRKQASGKSVQSRKDFNTIQTATQAELQANDITNPLVKNTPIPDIESRTQARPSFEAGGKRTLELKATEIKEKVIAKTHNRGEDVVEIKFDNAEQTRVDVEQENQLQLSEDVEKQAQITATPKFGRDNDDIIYEEEFEADQLDEIESDVWPSEIEEELEQEELVREAESPLSNVIVEEDREEGLIQAFRANTSELGGPSTTSTIKESTTAVNGSDKKPQSKIESKETSERDDFLPVSRPTKKTTNAHSGNSADDNRNEDQKSTKISTSKTTMGSTTTTIKTTSTTMAPTTTTTTTQKLTTMPKTETTHFRTETGTQTTLPYIWREKSSWNDDGTLAKSINRTTQSPVKGDVTKAHHKNGRLSDFLELHETTKSSGGNNTRQGEGKIYLDESLTENLLGIQENLQDETEAELKGNDAMTPSGVSIVQFIVVLLVCYMQFLS